MMAKMTISKASCAVLMSALVLGCSGEQNPSAPGSQATTQGQATTSTQATASSGATQTSGAATVTAGTTDSSAAVTGTSATTSAATAATGAGGATTAGSTATTDATTSATSTTGGTTGGTLAQSVCPPGSESMAPVLTGTPTQVAGVPPNDGYSPFNIEGPVWVNGALYMSEIASGANPPAARILKYTPGVGVEVWKDDVGTNGLAIDTSGVLYGASHKDGSISRFDLQNPSAPPVPVVNQYMGTRFSSPNDLTISSAGRIYFTDPFYQAGNQRQAQERAYWFELQDPSVIHEIAGAPSPPNGISLSPDEQTLYVAGASPAMAFPVMADGSLGQGAQFGPSGVDGMGVDCAGNLYLAVYAAGTVVVLAPTGDQLGTINVATGITNVAFGGSDRTTLYISRLEVQELYEVNVGIPGLPY